MTTRTEKIICGSMLAFFAVGIISVLILASPGCITLPSQITDQLINPPVSPATNITPPVVTPPVVTPPAATTTVVTSSAQWHGVMFYPATPGAVPWSSTINHGVCSLQSYASSHGNAWENDYRLDGFGHIKAFDGDTMVYIADKWLAGADKVELRAKRAKPRMFLCDQGSPVDGHHISDAENFVAIGLKYGIKRHVVVLRDSPESGITPGLFEAQVKELATAYATARVEWALMTGLETKRNTAIADAARQVKLVQQYAPKARCIVGDQSADFLLQVLAQAPGVELWLEQDAPGGSPVTVPLTSATAPAYLASLGKLAAKVGAGKVWAGEWWTADESTRLNITAQILAAGMNCGCGQFAATKEASR